MKIKSVILINILFILFCGNSRAQFLKDQLLWPGGIPGNPVIYNEEIVSMDEPLKDSPSQMNRIISRVTTPTYDIYKPVEGTGNGVAMVIAPGGGFRILCFDREGSDFAIWLAKRGITSLVLKYRTFNPDAEGFKLGREEYDPHVYADARQAISILRSRSKELGIDKNEIGIGGFSAGGALSLYAALKVFEDNLPSYAKFEQNASPDFACLIYPGISDIIYEKVKVTEDIPPMFFVNGAQDNVTPAAKCIKLYNALAEKNVRAELHVYSKGEHGFDSGVDRGNGISLWRDSFVAWLKDLEFIR